MHKQPEWTIATLLNWATSYFDSNKIDSPRMTAEILLAHALNTERIDLYLQHDKPLLKEELSKFKGLIKRRILREPVAYITGSKEFWSLDLTITKDVLIPRPDTEFLVEAALPLLPRQKTGPKMHVLELGTGSGAVVIALAKERPGHLFFASDISAPAADLAKKNADAHQLQHAISFFCGSWFNAVKQQPLFDIILSNPPYIPSRDIEKLDPEISQFEPLVALDGDTDGLTAIKTIIETAGPCLKQGGYLLLEMGYDQMNQVNDLFHQCGSFKDAQFIKDYTGHYRVARLKKR
jgi:release factor glutamine methyltransferase